MKEIDQQIASLKKTLAGSTEEFLKSVLPGTGNQAGGGGSFLAEAKQRIIEQSIELQALDARKNALDGVIQDYEKKFNQIPKKSMDLARLQRTKMSNEKLYLLVEEKYNETAIQEKSEFGYVNVVDPAVLPVKPCGCGFASFLFSGLSPDSSWRLHHIPVGIYRRACPNAGRLKASRVYPPLDGQQYEARK